MLTFGGAALPAAAADSSDSAVQLKTSVDKYELAAAQSGDSASEIKNLEKAGLISVSDKGFFYYHDGAPDAHKLSELGLPKAPEGAPIAGDPAGGSRPGAPVTVYLDFDGETLTNRHWNTDSGIPTLNFAPANAVTDRASVWAAVAEDYAPFNVNVTTTRPSDAKLYKTSADDNEYGSHVIITDSYDEVLPAAADSGGIAWLGGTGSQYLEGALVFTKNTQGSPKLIAEIASHESGHNFGLAHDGIANSTTGEYYVPQSGVWGTIMGAAYYVPLSQWSAGAYAGATNKENDLAVITDRSSSRTVVYPTLPDGTPYTKDGICVQSGDSQNPKPGDVWFAVGPNGDCKPAGPRLTLNFSYTDRASYAADEVGNTGATAKALDNAAGTFTFASVIERTDDVDVFAVTTAGGAFSANVAVANISPNLDAKLTLTDSTGKLVAQNDPASARVSDSVASGLNAAVTANVPAGTYYLSVDGVGSGNPGSATPDNANGYTEYGSLGNYTLSGSASPLKTSPLVITSPSQGDVVTGGSKVTVTGTATPNATVTLTVGGKVVDTVTADATGKWTGSVTANKYGDTAIVAAQRLDDIQVPGTATVTVKAVVDAPVIVSPADGSETKDTTPTVSGTGIPGATVTVTVVAKDGSKVAATAKVAANGTWSVDLLTLVPGEYSATATQTINGATSAASNANVFTVVKSSNPGGGDGDGNGDGNGDGGDNLATTGSDFNASVFMFLAGGLVLAGGGTLAFGLRRRKASIES